MVPADSRRISRVLRYSGVAWMSHTGFAYGAVTLCGRASLRVRLPVKSITVGNPTTPGGALPRPRFGLFRFRSPLLAESLLFSLPAGTEMFQFPAFAQRTKRCDGIPAAGFPHSDIGGSCGYLPLAAAFRSLSRPSSPPRATGIPHAPFSAFLFSFRLLLTGCRVFSDPAARFFSSIALCFLVSLLLSASASTPLPRFRFACPSCQ